VRQLFLSQLHQSPGSERHGREPENGRVPAARRDVQGIGEPAVYFVSNDDRGDQLLSACSLGFCHREAWRDVVAWMNGELTNIGVVEVEVANSGTVGKGCEVRRRPVIGPDDGGRATDR